MRELTKAERRCVFGAGQSCVAEDLTTGVTDTAANGWTTTTFFDGATETLSPNGSTGTLTIPGYAPFALNEYTYDVGTQTGVSEVHTYLGTNGSYEASVGQGLSIDGFVDEGAIVCTNSNQGDFWSQASAETYDAVMGIAAAIGAAVGATASYGEQILGDIASFFEQVAPAFATADGVSGYNGSPILGEYGDWYGYMGGYSGACRGMCLDGCSYIGGYYGYYSGGYYGPGGGGGYGGEGAEYA